MASRPTVAILMGSDSDLPVMAECVKVLVSYGIACDVRVLSEIGRASCRERV